MMDYRAWMERMLHALLDERLRNGLTAEAEQKLFECSRQLPSDRDPGLVAAARAGSLERALERQQQIFGLSDTSAKLLEDYKWAQEPLTHGFGGRQ